MRRLFILRHAHSPVGPGDDKQRRLSAQGRGEATALGQLMADRQYRPAHILCSPALRTRETCELVMQGWPESGNIARSFPETLYNAPVQTLARHIEQAPDAAPSLMIVAHNPGIHMLALSLAGKSAPDIGAPLETGYRPCTLTVFDCPDESWGLAGAGQCRLIDLILPQR